MAERSGNNRNRRGRRNPLAVTPANLRRYFRGQENQFNPLLNRLMMQWNNHKDPEQDYAVQAINAALSGVATSDEIKGAYDSGLTKFKNELAGMDFGAGGRGVSSIVDAVAGAIGADAGAAKDVSAAAGNVVGQGGQGGDVYSKAIYGGAFAQMEGAKAAELGDARKTRMDLLLSKGAAKNDAVTRREELGKEIAQIRGQKMAARVNPLEIENMLIGAGMNRIQFAQALDALKKMGIKVPSRGKNSGVDNDAGPNAGAGNYIQGAGLTLSDLVTMFGQSTK